jgi:hypothetical protein
VARHSSLGILVALFSIILVAHVQDSAASPLFKLKADITGSHIPADAVTSSLPLKMNVYVDTSGKGQKVEVPASPLPETTRFAAGIATAIKWKPALCDGRPCAMAFPPPVNLKSRL